jgi:UDP-glucose 4-epimerase
MATVDKANTILGWKTELTIEEACRDAWNYASKNPNGYE